MNSIPYRSDINGLRGIAVLLVVCYHLKVSILSNGYIGVDIFFVISGYLMLEIYKKRKFNYIDFYKRRINRLWPAFFVMLFFTTILAWYTMLPSDLRNYGQSLATSSVFLSNILFWWETDYFALPANLKYLLHTWSLSVEAQFYLLFPFLFYLSNRKGLNYVILIGLIILSWTIFCWMLNYDQSAAYFMSPFRIWSFLTGILISKLMTSNGKNKIITSSLVFYTGLVMILFSSLDFLTGWGPYFCAIIGTSIVLLCNRSEPILSNRLIQYIGKISYSWYLWHWPLISLSSYYFIDNGVYPTMEINLLLGLILAIISYNVVEKNTRVANFINVNIFYGMSFLIAIGIIFHFSNGLEALAPKDVVELSRNNYENKYYDCHKIDSLEINCIFNQEATVTQKLIVFGDSHMKSLIPAISNLARKSPLQIELYSYNNCFAFDEAVSKGCKAFQEKLFQITNKGDHILLVGKWSGFNFVLQQAKGKEQHFTSAFSRLYSRLYKLGVQVWVLEQVPEFSHLSSSAMKIAYVKGSLKELPPLKRKTYISANKEIHDIFVSFIPKGLQILSPINAFCDQDKCDASDGKKLYFRDTNHLTEYGALKMEKTLRPFFTKQQESP